MKRTFTLLSALALLLGLASLLPAAPSISSGGLTEGGVRVTSISLPPHDWLRGTFVFRLRLDNTQPFPQDVTCSVEGLSYSSSVRIAASGSATLAIPFPASEGTSVYRVLLRDAKGETHFALHDSVYFSSAHGYSLYQFDDIQLYLSPAFSSDDVKAGFENYLKSLSAPGSSYGSYHQQPGYKSISGDDANVLKSAEVSGAWPSDWRCYSPFDACLIADRDYSAIPESGKEALREYVIAGGNVILVGAKDECLKIISAFGCDSLSGMLVGDDLEKMHFTPCGLGSLGYFVTADYANFAAKAAKAPWFKEAVARFRDAKSVFDHDFLNTPSKNPYFNIDNSLREAVPSRLFIALLLVFVILSGPVSIRVLAKRNKRIWLLWVLPAISLCFSAAIILSMLWSEGVKPTSTRDAVTFLGQADGRAVTIGGVSVYSPLSLSGMDFRNDSDVLPLSSENQSPGEIVAGKTLHYGSGWVRPRIPRVFAVRRTDTLRERVEVTRAEDGSIEIVNALGAPLKSITVWDENGEAHSAENVSSGAKVRLSQNLLSGKAVSGDDKTRNRITAAFNSKYAYNGLESYEIGSPVTVALDGDVATVNFKCLYAAEIDGACPFLDDPLAGRKHICEDSALVIGSYGFRSAEKGGDSH